MKKAIIFDLDGTLLNTIKDINVSINKTLEYFGYKKLNIKKTKANVGYGSKELVRKVLPKNTTPDVRLKATNHYLETYSKVSGTYAKPYRGIMKLLETLKTSGYKLAVVSNKDDHLVSLLNEQLFENIFEITKGVKKGVERKPHPQMIKETLKALNVTKDEAIYVGDTEVDIRTAKNAFLDVVAVTWGFRSLEELVPLKPNYIIKKPKQLLAQLNYLNENGGNLVKSN